MNKAVRILVVDKYPSTLAALQNWLDETKFQPLPYLVAQFVEVADYCRTYQPDILALAVKLLPSPPEPCIANLRREYANTKIVLVADDHDHDVYLPGLIRAGVVGYILHSEAPEMWQSCFRAVAGTGTYFNEESLARCQRVLAVGASMTAKNELTERDIQLLHLLAQECDNTEIAEQLSLSPCTVGNNLSGLYKKLGVKGRLGAMIWAWQVGLIEDVFEDELEWVDE